MYLYSFDSPFLREHAGQLCLIYFLLYMLSTSTNNRPIWRQLRGPYIGVNVRQQQLLQWQRT
ncbi:uncharacterized protein BP01DRAFT_164110 [Aspergillus saccharolyticus JOP 1030-1]|uniref:Uncharacterized protein n=1 Tax=Aspergillus saccharolyticus JOP 1030-1 TaxID=1450539 RepID=A0A318Z2N8_9EURO|nr:hypothetical protein BP01DRAFT_164110 [Aspergillus saccharolyticus JOP 1030-1]PYH41561.1 hypothetical protein BP01DRAFT_164110 [Aspergillus saccharolyticus JOP 1030-1]